MVDSAPWNHGFDTGHFGRYASETQFFVHVGAYHVGLEPAHETGRTDNAKRIKVARHPQNVHVESVRPGAGLKRNARPAKKMNGVTPLYELAHGAEKPDLAPAEHLYGIDEKDTHGFFKMTGQYTHFLARIFDKNAFCDLNPGQPGKRFFPSRFSGIHRIILLYSKLNNNRLLNNYF
jgi:hypothetical protein